MLILVSKVSSVILADTALERFTGKADFRLGIPGASDYCYRHGLLTNPAGKAVGETVKSVREVESHRAELFETKLGVTPSHV